MDHVCFGFMIHYNRKDVCFMTQSIHKFLCLLLMLLLALPGIAVAAEEKPVELSLLTMSGSRTWLEENKAIQLFQERMNVKLDVEMAQNVTEQLNLYVASGDVPDIVRADSMTYINYLDTGYFLELTDLLNEYGQDILATVSQKAWDMTRVGEKIYVIPYENYSSKYTVGIRADWLRELGITLSNPTHFSEFGESLTLDEYTDILRAFTAEDPDGNGENDTYGLSTGSASDWKTTFMHIFSAFGGQPTQYYADENGIVLPWEATQGFRSALEYLAGLWQEGVIDPEIFILNADQARQKMARGVAGSFCGWWSTAYQLVEAGALDINPEADWQPIYVTANDGKSMAMLDNGMITGTVMISKSCENPEKAMEMLNYMITPEGWMLNKYGVEGEHYTLDADGYVVRTELGTEMFNAGTLEPLSQIVMNMSIAMFQDSMPLSSTDPVQVVRYRFNRGVHDYELITSLFYGLPNTQEYMELGTDVAKYVEQMVIEFVTGNTPLTDETWQSYLEGYSQKGQQAILASYVEAYNDLNGTSLQAGSISG